MITKAKTFSVYSLNERSNLLNMHKAWGPGLLGKVQVLE
jgi:hypothetical protein